MQESDNRIQEDKTISNPWIETANSNNFHTLILFNSYKKEADMKQSKNVLKTERTAIQHAILQQLWF